MGWGIPALINLNKVLASLNISQQEFNSGIPKPFKDRVREWEERQERELYYRLKEKYER